MLRSPGDTDVLVAGGVHVRLVKGADVETVGAHPYGEPTDVAYLRLGFRLAQADATWSLATHDGRLREALLLALGPVPVEQPLDVRPEAMDDLRDRDIPTRVTSPTALTGSAIGSAGSPSAAALDPSCFVASPSDRPRHGYARPVPPNRQSPRLPRQPVPVPIHPRGVQHGISSLCAIAGCEGLHLVDESDSGKVTGGQLANHCFT